MLALGGAEVRKGGGGGGCSALGDPWLLTPNFEMTFFPFWCQFPIYVDLMGQRKDASLGSKAELCSFSKSFSLTEIQSASG